MTVEIKTETLTQAAEKISSTKAYQLLCKFFDDGVFTEIGAFSKSSDGYAEVIAAHGTVNGLGVYAYAQNADIAGGAMSKAQSAKIKKLYDLALKTGEPVVAVYDSAGGRLSEGTDLLAAYGDVLKYSSNLSGVVPQISVITGKCYGTQAMIAACGDIVIMSENGRLSLNTSGEGSSAKENFESGNVHILAKDDDEAIQKAKELIEILPSNNLSSACVAYDSVEAESIPTTASTAAETAVSVSDSHSSIELQSEYGKAIKTYLATVNGTTAGLVAAEGEIDGKSSSKAERFVRFCDAFSIPVVTFVNAQKFKCIKGAVKLTSAYAEATTAKVTFITGDAFGSVYIALAGTGAAADLTFAFENASVSALTPEAEAVIMLGDDFGGKLKGSKNPQADKKAVIEEYKRENLTAMNAAANGYVEDVITPENAREKLISALDILSNKRVSTLPKKHSV